jgi:RNA polymerase sigma-70 factor (ECF subfamily)
LKQQDRESRLFEVFVRENEGPLVTYIRSLVRDPGLADDLFQETLITAWRRFDDFDTSRPLAPWLRGIAFNLVRNAKRKRAADFLFTGEQVAVFIEQAVAQVADVNADSWSDRLVHLRDCLGSLTDRSRSLIQFRYAQQQTAIQIAEHSGDSASGVRKQLQRIRDSLWECVQQRLREALQ